MLDTVIYVNVLFVLLWFMVGILLSTIVYLYKPTRAVFVSNTEDKVLGGCMVALFSLLGVFAVLLPVVSYYYVRLKTKSAIH